MNQSDFFLEPISFTNGLAPGAEPLLQYCAYRSSVLIKKSWICIR